MSLHNSMRFPGIDIGRGNGMEAPPSPLMLARPPQITIKKSKQQLLKSLWFCIVNAHDNAQLNLKTYVEETICIH